MLQSPKGGNKERMVYTYKIYTCSITMHYINIVPKSDSSKNTCDIKYMKKKDKSTHFHFKENLLIISNLWTF